MQQFIKKSSSQLIPHNMLLSQNAQLNVDSQSLIEKLQRVAFLVLSVSDGCNMLKWLLAMFLLLFAPIFFNAQMMCLRSQFSQFHCKVLCEGTMQENE